MIEINFYREFKTTWEELQKMALDVISEVEADSDDEEAEACVELPDTMVNGDYRKACEIGLKTMIFDVLNDWGRLNLVYIDKKFYRKENVIEIDNRFKYLEKNLFKTTTELFEQFKLEMVQLTTDEYDLIMDNFESDMISTVFSFDIKYIDIEDSDYDDDDDDDDY
jgi:hypothetical protein